MNARDCLDDLEGRRVCCCRWDSNVGSSSPCPSFYTAYALAVPNDDDGDNIVLLLLILLLLLLLLLLLIMIIIIIIII
jgi:hypothetical protein